MIRVFNPETHCDEGSVLAILATGPRSVREVGNRLRRNILGVRVYEAMKRLEKRGLVVGRHDELRNAWIYRVAVVGGGEGRS